MNSIYSYQSNINLIKKINFFFVTLNDCITKIPNGIRILCNTWKSFGALWQVIFWSFNFFARKFWFFANRWLTCRFNVRLSSSRVLFKCVSNWKWQELDKFKTKKLVIEITKKLPGQLINNQVIFLVHLRITLITINFCYFFSYFSFCWL